METRKIDDTRIIRFEDDGFEMNITVESSDGNVLEDHDTLEEIVKLVVSKGFSRFVGTAG